jgi:hypothetical protein
MINYIFTADTDQQRRLVLGSRQIEVCHGHFLMMRIAIPYSQTPNEVLA